MRRKLLRWAAALLLCAALFCIPEANAINTKIRVGFVRDQAPYHFVDEDGRACGMYIDMLEHIAADLRYDLEYYPLETTTACLAALENGEIDVILDIKQKYNSAEWMSDALAEEAICTVVNKNALENGAPPIGTFQRGTLGSRASGKLATDYNYVTGSQKQSVDYMLSGKASMMVGMLESVLYYMGDAENSDDYSIENSYIGVVSSVFIVHQNNYFLLSNLNNAIAELRSSKEYKEIRLQWSLQDSEGLSTKWLSGIIIALLSIVAVMASVVTISSSVRKELKRQVDEKTHALQQANKEILRHMEQLERESELRNRIISYSHLGMVLFDCDYHIKLINTRALMMANCGYEPKDVRDAGVFGGIVAACGADIWHQKWEESGENVRIYEESGKKYRFTFQQLLHGQENWDILLAVEDATGEEARRTAAFEKEKSKLLSQVVAGIAHEIKNPLMSIRTFVGLIREKNEDPQFIEDFTHYVPGEVDRINRLVEGLISYARPAKGPQTLLNLTELVQETVFFAKNTNRVRQISVDSNLEDGHCIMANRDQIKQVLINIILNGMESMREKLATQPDLRLHLCIELSGSPDESHIIIRDEGMGMSPQAIARCMEPFFTTKRTGTGLGLTLSKQYVQDNNGSLSISSSLGEYTEISITFGRSQNETSDFNY